MESNEIKNQEKGPMRYPTIVEDFFRNPDYERKYIKPLIKTIISEGLANYIPELRLDISDLDLKLIDLFRKDALLFLEYVREGLYNRLIFEVDIKEVFSLLGIGPEDMNIIPNTKDFENLIPNITNLSKNLTRYKGQFVYFNCRYMNIGIDKIIGFNWINYRCPVCLSEFQKFYKNNIDTRIRKPDHCIKAKCHNKDFEIVDSDSFEIGNFLIEDLDIKKREFISCYILRNIDYFYEKVKSINLNEEIELLGILQINYSDLVTRKETQKFEYYIEVYDINPKKIKCLDNTIIEALKKNLENDPTYFEKLIDATHSLTYLIDIYFPIKFLNASSFITGGSWNKENNIRDTLNIMNLGPKATFKSSISRSLEKIVGKREYLVHEVDKEMTKAGLIGT
ncbi:MAG: hypothetical protein ACFFKA_13130, partial [Candidatus Thorarchaeota archaeon]